MSKLEAVSPVGLEVVKRSGSAPRLGSLTGKSGGIEDLNIAEYPGPLGIHDPAQITQNIESDLVGKIIAGLTGGSGEAAAASAKRNPKDIVFTGTPGEVGRYFDAQEWSDGLPIV